MSDNAKPLKIKAAGGVKSKGDALKMITFINLIYIQCRTTISIFVAALHGIDNTDGVMGLDG